MKNQCLDVKAKILESKRVRDERINDIIEYNRKRFSKIIECVECINKTFKELKAEKSERIFSLDIEKDYIEIRINTSYYGKVPIYFLYYKGVTTRFPREVYLIKDFHIWHGSSKIKNPTNSWFDNIFSSSKYHFTQNEIINFLISEAQETYK